MHRKDSHPGTGRGVWTANVPATQWDQHCHVSVMCGHVTVM